MCLYGRRNMFPDKRVKEHLERLKRMGVGFFCLAVLFSLTAYLLPNDETIYWLSSRNKEGIYALSALFVFFGLYCLGARWRKRHFV